MEITGPGWQPFPGATLRAAGASVHRYVMFLNLRLRSQLWARYPSLPFTEIMKMSVAQWAQLSQEEEPVSLVLLGVWRVPVCKAAPAVCSLEQGSRPRLSSHWSQRELSGMQTCGPSHPTPAINDQFLSFAVFPKLG